MSLRLLATLALAFAVLFCAGGARAQVRVQTEIAAHKVELGDAVQFQITAMSSTGDPPQNPRLAPIPGLSIMGPSTGTRTQVSINNGRMQQESGISATWNIQAVKVGTYRIGPATVDLGGQRFQSQVETLEVVPQGTLPRGGQRGGGPQPFDPFRFFDPFGGGSPFPPGLFPPGDLDQQQELPPVPDELKVERAPDPIAFLRAVVTPKHPVVGEQVTVRIYAYGGRGIYRPVNAVDPTYPDFLDYTGQDDSFTENAVQVPIGEQVFIAQKLRELCLFPLHAGKLTIGPMTLTFTGGRYVANPPITRSSPPITLDVVEPPLDNRPPGYHVGDVGTLELSVAVDPRRVTAGDTVGVVAKLEGTGSIPTSLRVPEQRGVEWLDPTHVDEVHEQHGVVRGFRAFTYLVKMTEPGHIDLGELTLPYWDPRKRAYATARASLGKVDVAPNPQKAAPVASAAAAKTDEPDALALKPRHTLAPYGPTAAPFTDSLRFWYLLLGAPVAVGLAGVGPISEAGCGAASPRRARARNGSRKTRCAPPKRPQKAPKSRRRPRPWSARSFWRSKRARASARARCSKTTSRRRSAAPGSSPGRSSAPSRCSTPVKRRASRVNRPICRRRSFVRGRTGSSVSCRESAGAREQGAASSCVRDARRVARAARARVGIRTQRGSGGGAPSLRGSRDRDRARRLR